MVMQHHKPECHAKKLVHYSMSRSQQGLIESNFDYLRCTFQTADWFATKFGLTVWHHKQECPVEKLDYCIQGQGPSKGSKCQ